MTAETKASPKMYPLPDVSRPAWEARFGKPTGPQQSLITGFLQRAFRAGELPDVSKHAWEARFGKPPAGGAA